jgi:polysaccharide export outer membrane protein
MSLCRNPVRALLLCGAAALSACSTVPSGGPSRQAVFDVGTQTNSPFLLVQLSDFVIQELAHFPGPSLYGRFGDYRAAVEQHIGVGDTVGITIFEAAAGGLFSQPVAAGATGSHSAVIPKQLVQRDGAITVPYAGRVQVAGLTPQAVEKTIVERLTGKAIEPQVIVSLSRNIASSVTVSGEVLKGARIPLSARGDRLLDVIATAGALNAPAHETFVELGRDGRVVRVPFQTLMANPKENIYARPGDTLTLIHYPLTFTAVGATMRNSVIKFDAAGISLEEAIGKSSGLLDERADPEGVFVMRYEPVSVVRNYPGLTPQQAALNLVPVAYVIDMRDPKALFLARKFPMHDKDVLYVSNSPFSDLAKVLGLVNSIASPALQGASIAQTLRNTSNSNSSAASLALASTLNAGSTTTSTGTGASTTR